MSQIIVAQNRNGIVLAAESRAIQLDERGQEISFQVNRLLPLTSHTALLTAGAPEGVDMGNALRHFLEGEELSDVQDIHGAALAFLSTEYERFMRKKCELVPIDPIHQVSFILAGRTMKDPVMPFRLYFLWTKKKLPRLDADEISFALSLPRRMGLEFQINKTCREEGSLGEILNQVAEGMKRLKDREEVRSPVAYAIITPEGYQPVNP